MKYIESLRLRHADRVLGYHGQVDDAHILGWITREVGILSPHGFNVAKCEGYWLIHSDVDWIRKFTESDVDYFHNFFSWPDYAEGMMACGALIHAYTAISGTAINGTVTWLSAAEERGFVEAFAARYSGRLVFFKSVENNKPVILTS